MKPFEIFKTGTHTSEQGEGLSFSDADLSDIASGYNPELHHAPIVVGHPKSDNPAYGWIASLAVSNGRLVATPSDVDAAFADLVKDKKFKSRSASFYKPDHPNNPIQGKWYLRHVGFLGAAAPAVKGLKPVEFADDDGVVFADLEFADGPSPWIIENIARMFRGIRDFILEKEGVEKAEAMLPQWNLDDLIRGAADMRADSQAKTAFYSDPSNKETDMNKEELAAAEAREAEINAREQALKAKETAFAEQAATARANEDKAFVAGIVQAGRLPKGLEGHAVAMFADLSEGDVMFSDGAADVKMSPRAAFRDLLQKLPSPVVTGELIKGDAVDFSDATAVTAAIDNEIAEAKAKGQEISPAQAAMRLQQKVN